MCFDFSKIIREHTENYPLMMPQDYCKLAYQSEFGPEHMLANLENSLAYIDREWSALSGDKLILSSEAIGNGLCRFYMHSSDYSKEASQLLGELFYLTAKEHSGSQNGLYKRLDDLERVAVVGLKEYIAEYKTQGCPAVHHSEVYREAYDPHYRLLKWEYACYFDTILRIKMLDKPGIVAIDGRCGSGKTSLATLIQKIFDCNVFHMDDYYLPMSQRDEKWEQIPAGNMDINRFKDEILSPAKAGETIYYRPYNCGTGEYGEIVQFPASRLTVIEGSYSHHPELSEVYDLKIFLTSSKEVQARRLMKREGDYYSVFQKRWIPMEELYLHTYDIEKNSDLTVDTSKIF